MDCYEVMQRGRNFRLLSEEEQPQLLSFLATYLPESLKFHQTLLTYMRDKVWDFYFYVANGWPDEPLCLHFPGMTLSPHGMLYESIGIFCPSDQLDLLRLVHDEDMLIDWSRPLYINFVHIDTANELVRLYEDTGTVDMLVVDVWACDNPETLEDGVEQVEEECDRDVQVLPLKAEHAEGIYELYPANDIECHEVFLRLIRTLPAAGVFCKDRLAAWMVQSYYGAMFSMQTKPEYRRKGYGTKLARYLAKRVADRGYYPFVVIRPDNEASQSLYKKLGFRKLYQTARMIFMPSTWEETDSEARCILSGNLHNAMRQLAVESRVINALRDNEGTLTQFDCDEKEESQVIAEKPQEEANCVMEGDLRPQEDGKEAEGKEEQTEEIRIGEYEEARDEVQVNENTKEKEEEQQQQQQGKEKEVDRDGQENETEDVEKAQEEVQANEDTQIDVGDRNEGGGEGEGGGGGDTDLANDD